MNGYTTTIRYYGRGVRMRVMRHAGRVEIVARAYWLSDERKACHATGMWCDLLSCLHRPGHANLTW